MRLLTEEELMQIRRDMGGMYQRDYELIQAGSIAQDAKTQKATLKAVGEFLEDKYLIVDPITHEPKGYWVDLVDGNSFKRGEMPKEGE